MLVRQGALGRDRATEGSEGMPSAAAAAATAAAAKEVAAAVAALDAQKRLAHGLQARAPPGPLCPFNSFAGCAESPAKHAALPYRTYTLSVHAMLPYPTYTLLKP